MTMGDFDEQQPSSQEMAALELYHQLLNLTPDDGDRALMVTLRLPNGRYVGDVWLSSDDVEKAVDGLLAVNVQRADTQDGLIPAAPLPDWDTDDTDEFMAEVEEFLKSENGGQA